MKIVHASISENNNAGWDGKAKPGDQTGKEVCVTNWFSKSWDFMLRYPDVKVAEKAAAAAVKLANSNLVGYNQSTRNTLYQALKAVNYDVDTYIKSGKKTETDCSAFVYAVYACFLPAIRSNDNAPVTYTMKNIYKKWGFLVYTNAEYLTGVSCLNTGDILVNSSTHTVIATDGTAATVSTQPVNNKTVSAPAYSTAVQSAIDTIARDVLTGKWGTGEERKEKLYKAIQNRVNELMK